MEHALSQCDAWLQNAELLDLVWECDDAMPELGYEGSVLLTPDLEQFIGDVYAADQHDGSMPAACADRFGPSHSAPPSLKRKRRPTRIDPRPRKSSRLEACDRWNKASSTCF